MEKEARREVGRDVRSGIICSKEIFDRKPYIVPNRIMVKCELRDVIYSLLYPLSKPLHFEMVVFLDMDRVVGLT